MLNVPPWTNQDLRPFHGTSHQYASEIVNRGVDISRGRPDVDFGRGFSLHNDFVTGTSMGTNQVYGAGGCRIQDRADQDGNPHDPAFDLRKH